VVVEKSTTWSVLYNRSYATVTVQGGTPEVYVLLRCGAPLPPASAMGAGATLISVPVSRTAALETPALPLISVLMGTPTLVAFQNMPLVSTPAVRDRVSALLGTPSPVVDSAYPCIQWDAPSTCTNYSAINAAKPSVVFAGYWTAAEARAGGCENVVLLNELNEASPLGRAEYLKASRRPSPSSRPPFSRLPFR
jgi:iron complex transport system substrate-binding protein